jgi:hypothetical protein
LGDHLSEVLVVFPFLQPGLQPSMDSRLTDLYKNYPNRVVQV